MHLFLIRHGETEHNVASLLAGWTDSILTNHGVLQTQRLGKYLASSANFRFTHIFASDLQRAYMTAEAIRDAQLAQWKDESTVPRVVKLEILREIDFGSLELTSWVASRAYFESNKLNPDDKDFKPRETKEAMAKRSNDFIDNFLVPILTLEEPGTEEVVAVVSHGIFLSNFWRTFLDRFPKGQVDADTEVLADIGSRAFENITHLNNTGYLHLHLLPKPRSVMPTSIGNPKLEEVVVVGDSSMSPFGERRMTIKVVNGKAHLLNLKRTGGGVGSATYDSRQKNIDRFFKKPRQDEEAATSPTEDAFSPKDKL